MGPSISRAWGAGGLVISALWRNEALAADRTGLAGLLGMAFWVWLFCMSLLGMAFFV
ncbi:hypothetical protein METBIDRAFT_30220 [Metschnikowia bicuspidata var. bicuspidata NRRL YB-4993]|uniref:Uncharacterized protein n=1 Tax=Metschnikowia bicuspidata var. bicuspidata NRRL YB-4993 TaxID=869754 RepID=A0A1A0HIJ0_9ASCO|nr:hypothetical protein METBIDRAFT_30220 [Metschnikowia bicuspidata var. bicuspidata NRRL YB-4993]OBA23830.1 hypothetical protein METBIDRAFT_30220 [Metschnikowia bicuspidata var. bicuspidata NRRL YB-4993]